MFCANCGVELIEGTKFCPNCGNKISYESNISVDEICVEDNSNEGQNEDVYQTVQIFGNQYSITYEMVKRSNVKGIIRKQEKSIIKNMLDFYFKSNDMTTVAKELNEQGTYQLMNAFKVINTELMELMRVGKINIDAFRGELYDFVEDWNNKTEDILLLYNNLLNERNEFLAEIERDYRHDVPNPNANLYMQEYYKKQYDAYIKEYNKGFKKAYELPETIEKLKNGLKKIMNSIECAFIELLETKGFLEQNISYDDEIISDLSYISTIEDKCGEMYSLLQKNPDNSQLLNYAFVSDIGDKEEIVNYCNIMNIAIEPITKIVEIEKILMNTNYSDYIDISKSIDNVSYICSKYMIDGDGYIDFLKMKLENSAESVTVFDGILYSSLEEGLEARKALNEILHEVSLILDDDRTQMFSLVEKLKKAPIDSNEKYITYLENAIANADKNAKIVNGYVFENEEEALKNKESIKYIYDKMNSIPDVDSVAYLMECKEYSETNIERELVSDIITRIDMYIQVFEKCDELVNKYSSYIFGTRSEYTAVMVEMEEYNKLLEMCNMKHEDFSRLYNMRLKDFKNVFGTITKDIDDAIREYVSCVKHAISYKNSLEQSQAPKKKGFFGNLKNTVKGLWNSQYEVEYNRVTLNGQKEIPNETDETLQNMNNMFGEVNRRVTKFKGQLDSFVIKDPYSSEKKYLNMKELFIHNKNCPNEFPIDEISDVLLGTVIEVRTISNSIFEPEDVVYNHLSTVDPYQFITFNQRFIPEWFKDTKKYYCVIYTDISNVRESMLYLKEKRIPCEIIKYRVQL